MSADSAYWQLPAMRNMPVSCLPSVLYVWWSCQTCLFFADMYCLCFFSPRIRELFSNHILFTLLFTDDKFQLKRMSITYSRMWIDTSRTCEMQIIIALVSKVFDAYWHGTGTHGIAYSNTLCGVRAFKSIRALTNPTILAKPLIDLTVSLVIINLKKSS